MRAGRQLAGGRSPRWTVRLRLTLLYGALSFASGAALLTVTYVLMRASATGIVQIVQMPSAAAHTPPGTALRVPHASRRSDGPGRSSLAGRGRARLARRQRAADLNQLLIDAGIALGVLTAGSVALGWVIAGRLLSPLRTITATTRRISDTTLHERLAISGQRGELKDLGDTIDGLLARLESAFDAQRRFVANASHELRTPLAMMRTSLDVATGKPGPPSPGLTSLETKLREGLDQADQLVEGFLTLARAENGAIGEHTTVDLKQVVSSAIQRRQRQIDDAGLEIDLDLASLRVEGSLTLLARMVDNLIDNAIAYNEPRGWVAVRIGTLGEIGKLTVESGGRQLDAHAVSELALPFRRLAAARTHSDRGVGLGLSIVDAIATAHDGALELHARPQGGIRVVIELPATPVALPVPA